MRKYLVTRLVSGLLFAAAIIVLILGIVTASVLGLSGGWGPGSRVWVVVPIVLITIFNTVILLVFGAILFFLTRIEMDLEIARGRGKPGRPHARVVAPPRAPTLDRGPSAPVEERAPEAAAVASVAAAAAVGAVEAANAEPVLEPQTAADAPLVSEEFLPSQGVAAEPAANAETAVAPEPPTGASESIARLPGVEIFDEGTSETPESADVADNSGSLKLPGTDEAARIAREMDAFRPGPLVPPADDAPVEPPAPPEGPAN
jgi:hypothetical protein